MPTSSPSPCLTKRSSASRRWSETPEVLSAPAGYVIPLRLWIGPPPRHHPKTWTTWFPTRTTGNYDLIFLAVWPPPCCHHAEILLARTPSSQHLILLAATSPWCQVSKQSSPFRPVFPPTALLVEDSIIRHIRFPNTVTHCFPGDTVPVLLDKLSGLLHCLPPLHGWLSMWGKMTQLVSSQKLQKRILAISSTFC